MQIELSLNDEIKNELQKLNYDVQVINPATCLQLIMKKITLFMAMETLEDQMLLLQEIFMTDKLMIIAMYALPALILLIICFRITKK